jgi:hypothetical protein
MEVTKRSEAALEGGAGRPSLDYFKVSEAHRLGGQFDRERRWDEARRDELFVELASAVRGARSARDFTASAGSSFC